ncbi:hypothetical protein HDU87_006567 [Geranomyces variabilis]|uniref:EndoU domain-containing protein n=1 Tax=Geranomyces variabilis TaxID=109894 RepID=A0AAD5XNT1_9FUNG|nr:hypothetical protein HDU87_006567 [Geranomyces variabilis]
MPSNEKGPMREIVALLKKIGLPRIKKFLKKLFQNSDDKAAGGAWANGPPQQPQQQQPYQQQQQPQPQQHQQQAGGNAWANGAPQNHQQAPPPQQNQQVPVAKPQATATDTPEPTQEEMNNFAAAAAKLWELDGNRLQPGSDFVLNLQQTTKVYGTTDRASESLFKNVSPSLFQRFPTYVTFQKLLDNYTAQGGTAEVVTAEEIREQDAFIAEICKTAPIQYVHKLLVAMQLAPRELAEFGKLIKKIWFELYKREAANDSSAFEHTFIGEIKRGQGVIGFHNWIQFMLEERSGNADYRGWITPRGRRFDTAPEAAHILSFQLAWHGEIKPVSTFFIGTSPEFEIALYTLAFMAGQEDNAVVLEGVELNLKVYRFQGGKKLGSVFPVSG